MKRTHTKLNTAEGQTKRFGVGMLSPTVVILLIMTAYPLIFTFFYSFTNYNLLRNLRSPAKITVFQNYVKLLKDPYFQQSIWNTVKFTIFAVIFEMLIGFAMALFVNSLHKGQKTMRTLLLLPYLLPTVTVALSWRMMLSPTTASSIRSCRRSTCRSSTGFPIFARRSACSSSSTYGRAHRSCSCCCTQRSRAFPRVSMRPRASTARTH